MTHEPAATDTVHFQRHGAVATITLDRPHKANAYDVPMLEALHRAIMTSRADPSIRVLLIGSRGKHFCAGADLEEIATRGAPDALDLRSAEVFQELALSPKVTLAAIHGAAVGGGLELALACDLRVACPSAFFEFPEIRHGLLPAAGGTYRLVDLVGMSRAKALVLGGLRVDGRTALAWGLVQRLVPDDALQEEAMAWAQRIARNDALALRLAKQALHVAAGIEPGRQAAQASQAILYELAHRRNVR